jgi:hypothetical protein
MDNKNDVICSNCGSELRRRNTKTGTYFCNIKCKSEWQVKQRELLGFTKDWLIYQYFTLNKTCNDIAREQKRDPKSVWNWFKSYGIKIHKRGTYDKPHFKLGRNVSRPQSDVTKEKIRQARLIDGHVPYLKDGIHWLKHPDAISPAYRGGITPERQSIYSSIEWINCVKEVWIRDNATCQDCGQHQNDNREHKYHIHHIKSFAEYPELRLITTNLILLCQHCHQKRHSKRSKLKIK